MWIKHTRKKKKHIKNDAKIRTSRIKYNIRSRHVCVWFVERKTILYYIYVWLLLGTTYYVLYRLCDDGSRNPPRVRFRHPRSAPFARKPMTSDQRRKEKKRKEKNTNRRRDVIAARNFGRCFSPFVRAPRSSNLPGAPCIYVDCRLAFCRRLAFYNVFVRRHGR